MIFLVRWMVLLLGLVAGTLAFAQAVPGGIAVMESAGVVRFRIGDSPPQTVGPGQVIPVGARITTGVSSSVMLRFPDGMVVALGARSRLRVLDFTYVPNQIDRSRVLLNLTDGSVRFVMGAIGQRDPGLILIQVGTGSLAQAPARGAGKDVSVTVRGIATMLRVTQGRAALTMPSGQTIPLSAGQGALVSADGFAQSGGPSQLREQSGRSEDGKEAQDGIDEMQRMTFPPSGQQTSFVLATPHSNETESDDQGRGGQALLPLPPQPVNGIAPPPQPMTGIATTSSTGAGGGGAPCTASCN